MNTLSWRAHAVLVALVVAFALAAAVNDPPDANIGLGLALLALGALGAPWSLPVLLAESTSLDSVLYVTVAVAGALLNLVLHALARRWWSARGGRGAGGGQANSD